MPILEKQSNEYTHRETGIAQLVRVGTNEEVEGTTHVAGAHRLSESLPLLLCIPCEATNPQLRITCVISFLTSIG